MKQRLLETVLLPVLRCCDLASLPSRCLGRMDSPPLLPFVGERLSDGRIPVTLEDKGYGVRFVVVGTEDDAQTLQRWAEGELRSAPAYRTGVGSTGPSSVMSSKTPGARQRSGEDFWTKTEEASPPTPVEPLPQVILQEAVPAAEKRSAATATQVSREKRDARRALRLKNMKVRLAHLLEVYSAQQRVLALGAVTGVRMRDLEQEIAALQEKISKLETPTP